MKKKLIIGIGISTVLTGLLATAITIGVIRTIKENNYPKNIKFLYKPNSRNSNIYLESFIEYDRNTNVEHTLCVLEYYLTKPDIEKMKEIKNIDFYFYQKEQPTNLINFNEFCSLYYPNI